jgi:hypothetical protein
LPEATAMMLRTDHDVAAPLQRGELGPFAERRLDAVHAATGECAASRLQVDGAHV